MSDSRTCDTSVLVPALLSWHPAHEECRAAVVEVAVLPSHVFLETYSVLTRLPAPHRVAARDAAAAVRRDDFAVPGVSWTERINADAAAADGEGSTDIATMDNKEAP